MTEIILRKDVQRPLKWAEMDNNFEVLDSRGGSGGGDGSSYDDTALVAKDAAQDVLIAANTAAIENVSSKGYDDTALVQKDTDQQIQIDANASAISNIPAPTAPFDPSDLEKKDAAQDNQITQMQNKDVAQDVITNQNTAGIAANTLAISSIPAPTAPFDPAALVQKDTDQQIQIDANAAAIVNVGEKGYDDAALVAMDAAQQIQIDANAAAIVNVGEKGYDDTALVAKDAAQDVIIENLSGTVGALDGAVLELEQDIATNVSGIAANALAISSIPTPPPAFDPSALVSKDADQDVAIGNLSAQVGGLDAAVVGLEQDIATNVSGIAANASAISSIPPPTAPFDPASLIQNDTEQQAQISANAEGLSNLNAALDAGQATQQIQIDANTSAISNIPAPIAPFDPAALVQKDTDQQIQIDANTSAISNIPAPIAYTAGDGLVLDGSEIKMTGSYSGTFTAQGDIVAYSDMAIKEDFSPIEEALNKVSQLGGYTFRRKGEDRMSTGVVAQEVQKVLPEAVHDDGGTLGVAYGNMVGLLIEAVKELNGKVKSLEKELNITK